LRTDISRPQRAQLDTMRKAGFSRSCVQMKLRTNSGTVRAIG
jgi:hypothetical protein